MRLASHPVAWDIEGRTVVITGGNSGIGLATAVELAARGADVIITARTEGKGLRAADGIKRATGRSASAMMLDLASLDSVRDLAKEIREKRVRVDVLINNAGVYIGSRRMTPDGHEWTMGVNHLGHFLLTCLLTADPHTRPSRIVNVASDMHTHAKRDLKFEHLSCLGRYRATEAYARSKLANILFTRQLARRLEGTGVSAFAVHPGLVATRIAQDGDSVLGSMAWKLGAHWMRTPDEGAVGPVYLATEPGIEALTGSYFADDRPATPSNAGLADPAAARLWSLSVSATGCDLPPL